MPFPRSSLLALASMLPLLVLPSSLRAQIQPQARLDGELLPIATYNRFTLNVLKNGKKHQTRDLAYEVHAGSAFGEGFVEVTEVDADLDPLRDAPAKQRMHPSAIRFRYKASLTADRNLSDCYALLTFVTQGSVGTHLIAIGRLAAGRPKEIEAELRNEVDAVGSLHVFSDGVEVRSTDHGEAYDIKSYYAGLVKDVSGLPAAELLKFEEVYEHALSADGRYLATLRKRDAEKALIVYDLDSMKLLCNLPVAEADDVVRDLTWISDTEVAFVAEDDFEDRQQDFKLHLLDVPTAKVKVLLEDVLSIITALPDKPEVLVLHRWRPRSDSWMVKYDVHKAETFEMSEFGYGTSWFDRNGVDRLRVRYDVDKRVYYFKPTPESSWVEIDDAVKQPGLKFTLRGHELLERMVDVHSIGPDGDTLYISTRLNGDRFELAAFSMSEGVIKRTIAKHPKYDLTVSDGGLSRLLFAKRSPQLLGIVYEAQKPQIAWLDEGFAAVQKAMDKTFPQHVNFPLDWSKDGSTFVYFSTNDQDPGTYYVFRPLTPSLIPVLELAGNRLRGKTMAVTTPMEIPARDGQKIPVYLTRPPQRGTEPPPLIVNIHGGPMARDSWRFDATNQFFASRGYAVLQVNYRGSSGYGAAFQSAGLRARLDTVVLDDIADCVRHLIDQKEVDPTRIGVMGGSFGGWATYMSLIKYPELYRAGVAIAAVSHWRKSLRDDRWRFSNRVGHSYWKALLERTDFDENEKFIDPYLRAAEIKQPVYIMHGERDNVVHATEARLMLDALKKHNPHVQARSFPMAGHSYWSFADRVVTLNEMGSFFGRHLAPAKPPGSARAAQ